MRTFCSGIMALLTTAALMICAGPAAAFSEEENAAFLENEFLKVLESDYNIKSQPLLGDETLRAVGELDEFKSWRAGLLAGLDSASKIAQTSLGPVQYRREGSGPIILVFHGGMTGFDNIYLLRDLVGQGFQLICFSRPGYLRTPLGPGPSLPEEADMAAALLDSLQVSQPVTVYGTSLGGASALYFALNHSARTKALVMQDAVSQKYSPSAAAANSFLGRFFFGQTALDERSWILLEMAHRWPDRLFFEYLFITNHYDQNTNWEIARKCMADSEQRDRFILLLNMMSPLSLRMPGTGNEDQHTANLPDLPLQQIKVPALVTQGLMDADVEFSHAQYLVNRLPNVQLYTMRGVGHFYMFGDAWPGVLDRLVEFLRTVNPR